MFKEKYMICSVYDTETCNIGESEKTRAYPILFIDNDIRDVDLRTYEPDRDDKVSFYRYGEQMLEKIDEYIASNDNLPSLIGVPILIKDNLMYDGKKSISYEIFYNALKTVGEKMKNEEKSALEIWKQALDNVTPHVEVKSRRIGGATFQVPTEIRPDRRESVSMKNMILFARKRGGKGMSDKLAAEIMDAYNNQGGAFKRKEDMHRMAEANRAFAHFRF